MSLQIRNDVPNQREHSLVFILTPPKPVLHIYIMNFKIIFWILNILNRLSFLKVVNTDKKWKTFILETLCVQNSFYMIGLKENKYAVICFSSKILQTELNIRVVFMISYSSKRYLRSTILGFSSRQLFKYVGSDLREEETFIKAVRQAMC